MSWKVFNKNSHNSKYSKYNSYPCVIVISKRMIFTNPLFEMLGSPKRVLLLSDNNNRLGFRGIKESDPQFDEAYSFSSANSVHLHYFNATAFVRDHNLKPDTICTKVYMEDDIVIVNKKDFEAIK